LSSREENLARNRYGWQKRAKELARKQKHDDKMKRRQGKTPTQLAEELPEASEAELNGPAEIDAGDNHPGGPPLLD
jgi:hypothetical protein